MKKFISLLKAALSQDMDLFKIKANNKSSKLFKVILPIVLGFIVMFSVGTYSFMFASPLAKVGMTFVMLTLFIIVSSSISFMEGIYKSQGVLFECHDDNLLFSLPIKKSHILSVRLIKLLIFQTLFGGIFLLPSFVTYIYYENPGISFYIVSFLMLFLTPIIPTILSCIFGYIVKGISSFFNKKKLVQTILSYSLVLLIMYASFNIEGFVRNIAQNATSINDLLTKIYYPCGLYIRLIMEFKFIDFIKLLLVNIIPLIIFIYLASFFYFKINFKSGEVNDKKKNNSGKILYKKNKALTSLTKKELKRYFSSPNYIMNASFGLLLVVILTIGLAIKGDEFINGIVNIEEELVSPEKIKLYINYIYIFISIVIGCMNYVTPSCISLEGKSFNLTKSLPVKRETIFLSKILSCLIVTLPIMIICDIVFFIICNISIKYIVLTLLTTIIVPILTAIIGLLVNLKYPKMKFSNDIEVVKQSASALISILIGFVIIGISIFLIIKFFNILDTIIIILLTGYTMLTIILWFVLKSYGVKKFNEINV